MSRIHRQRGRLATVTAGLVSAAVLSVVPSGPEALAAGVWGPEEDLAVDVWNPELAWPIVRVRGDRTAVAAWVAGDSEKRVTVSRRGAGGGWTVPEAISADLSRGRTFDFPVDLAVARSGLASVVWERKVGTTWRIEESHLDGGAWSTPVQVGRGRWPESIVDGTGVTTVAWSNNGVRVARRPDDGAWSTPHRIAAGYVWDPELAANPNGDVALAWTARSRKFRVKVRASVRPHGRRSWAAPVTLGKGGNVQVAMGGRGRALALWGVWGIWNEAKHDYRNYLAWARSDARGHWSKTRKLTRQLGEDGGPADLSMNGDGRAVAAWLQIDRSDSPHFLWTARFRPDGSWTAPVRVSRTWSRPQAWLDRKGVAHVVSDRTNSARTNIWHFSQRRGAAWRARKLNRGLVLDAHGAGDRLVMLFDRRTLRSRTLDVR